MSNKKIIKDEDIEIVGAGGGKGGGQQRAPVEQENTLQSRSTAKIVHILSEGEIGGLAGSNPLQSVYFDQTPVEDTDGNPSFAGVYLDYRYGTPSQEPLSGFPELEDFFTVSTNIEDNAPVVRTIDGNADAARTIVRLPQGLTRLDEETGDLNGYVVGVAVDVRLGTSGTWVEVFDKLIRGKTTSAYEEAYRIERPSGTGTWQVRVRRTTVTEDSSRINELLQLWAVVEITDAQVSYEDAAVVGLGIDSEATGGQIPTQSFLIDGIKLQVPDVYQPTSYLDNGDVDTYASYSSTWDGATFKEAVSDDPAWIAYNLLINDRWGLGLDADMIDHYSFYEASQYNMELIPAHDGDGAPNEPRFRFNGNITTREDPYKVIQAVAATCRGIVYANPGLIRFIQDRPQTPQFNINNANVAEGKFIYSSTPKENRITSVNVTFNDIEDRYLPKVINEQADTATLDRYGYNQLEIGAMGVVTETQARRLAKWALDTAINVNEAVEFTVGWENAFLDVGDVFNLSDNDYADIQFSGKVDNISTDGLTIDLDRTVNLSGTETMLLADVTGNLISKNIDFASTGTGDVQQVVLSTAVDTNVFSENAEFVIQGQVTAREFKVTSVQESEGNGILTIQASRHDPNKYARVEQGITAPEPPTVIGGGDIAQPANVNYDIESVLTPEETIRFRIRLTWDDVDDPYLSHYLVRWRRNSGQYALSDKVTQSQFVIDNALPGFYEILVNTVNTRDVMSNATRIQVYVDISGQVSPLGPVSGLQLDTSQGGGTTFNSTFLNTVWTEPAEVSDTILKDYIVKLYDEFDFVTKIYVADTEAQTITRDEIIVAEGLTDPTPRRDVKVGVSARDTLNRISADEVFTTFNNPAPGAVSISNLTAQLGSYKVDHSAASENDFEGYKVAHALSSGFTPTKNNVVKNDVGTSHIVEAEDDQTYYVRVAAYDTWSQRVDELNFSAQDSVVTDFSIEDPEPGGPSNLVPASNIITLLNGTQVANIVLSWNRQTGENLVYDLEITEDGSIYGTPVISNPSSGSTVTWQFNGVIGREYCFRVRTRNGASVSPWSTAQCVTQAADTTDSGTPFGISAVSLYQGALVQWSNPSAANFSHTEVWRRIGSFGTGSKVADVSKPVQFFMDDGLDIGTNYQYRVRSVSQEGVVSSYTSWTSIVADNVPASSIIASSIAANSITANKIQSNAITADKVGANQIITTSANIGDATITSIKLEDSIESDNFVSGSSGWRIRRNLGDAEFGEITARGSIRTGTGTAQRTEITADDPTYVMWIGSGSKSDSNGIFWVKTDGTSFISDQVFDVGGGVSGGSSSSSGTATQSSNSAVAQTIVTPNGDVSISADFSYAASKFEQSSSVDSCPNSDYTVSGWLRCERSTDGTNWSTVSSRSFSFNGTCFFYDDPDPSIDPFYRASNSVEMAKSYVDTNPPSGTVYYRLIFSSWNSWFTSSQVSSNSLSISVVG